MTIEIEAFDANGKKLMSGPTPEHVDPKAYGGDPFQNDPRILPAFNGSSPSGNVTADVVYANFGTLEDFKKLASLGVSVKGKIVLVRYGGNFRGVKVYIAQQYGAVGVIIYSDPGDDGYVKGDMYPRGPYRPRREYSAAACSSCRSIRAIRRRRVWRRRRTCRILRALPIRRR